jgi:hypothetical protein
VLKESPRQRHFRMCSSWRFGSTLVIAILIGLNRRLCATTVSSPLLTLRFLQTSVTLAETKSETRRGEGPSQCPDTCGGVLGF